MTIDIWQVTIDGERHRSANGPWALSLAEEARAKGHEVEVAVQTVKLGAWEPVTL